MAVASATRRAVRRGDFVWPALDAAEYELSVIVPTRNEAASIAPLLEALRLALDGINAEVIFVDDSTDGTPSVVEAHAAESILPIRLRHRTEGERTGGLGGAVKLGFTAAKGRFVAVMDSDLQHPPALLPQMVAAAEEHDVDLVVGSRFVGSGSVGEFGAIRKALSSCSSNLAKVLFPRRLKQVTDPMSGLFLIRRERLVVERLQPHGFKILLEVLVRSAPLRVAEVPYTFGERAAGESKASISEGVRYLRHLLRLRLSFAKLRLIKFGLVGISGLVVNTLLLALLTSGAGLYYLASAFIATEASIIWNFVLSEGWVFAGNGQGGSRMRRLVSFAAINNIALALSGPLLWLLVSGIGLDYLLANLVSIGALMIVRFVISDRVIWRSADERDPATRTQKVFAFETGAPR